MRAILYAWTDPIFDNVMIRMQDGQRYVQTALTYEQRLSVPRVEWDDFIERTIQKLCDEWFVSTGERYKPLRPASEAQQWDITPDNVIDDTTADEGRDEDASRKAIEGR